MANLHSALSEHFRKNGLRGMTLEISMTGINRAVFGRLYWRKRIAFACFRLGAWVLRIGLNIEETGHGTRT